MKKKVRVILLEDIASLGHVGQIVTVAEGYARNSLFLEGKAALATPEVQEKNEAVQQKAAQTAAASLQALQAQAERLLGTELVLSGRLKEGEEIFGSITARDIASELNAQAGLTLTPKQIKLKKPIMKTGSQDIEINLSSEVATTIRVTIVPKKISAHEKGE